MLFPTTIVGNYPQPEWLIDRQKLAGGFPPRIGAREPWRVSETYLQEAWEDATLLAIRSRSRYHHGWRDPPGELFQPLSPPHWTVWIWIILESLWIDQATPIQCHGS
jgi:hypothetical protein